MKRFQAADANTLPNYSSQAEADPPNAQVLGSIPPAPSYPLQAAPRSSTISPLQDPLPGARGCFLLGKLFHLASHAVLRRSPSTCTPAHWGGSSRTKGTQQDRDLCSLLQPRLQSMAHISQCSFPVLVKAAAPLLSSAMQA